MKPTVLLLSVACLAAPAGANSTGWPYGLVFSTFFGGSSQVELIVELPAGTYKADWANTRTGAVDGESRFTHAGGKRTLASPEYAGDIALRIVSADYPAHRPRHIK